MTGKIINTDKVVNSIQSPAIIHFIDIFAMWLRLLLKPVVSHQKRQSLNELMLKCTFLKVFLLPASTLSVIFMFDSKRMFKIICCLKFSHDFSLFHGKWNTLKWGAQCYYSHERFNKNKMVRDFFFFFVGKTRFLFLTKFIVSFEIWLQFLVIHFHLMFYFNLNCLLKGQCNDCKSNFHTNRIEMNAKSCCTK